MIFSFTLVGCNKNPYVEFSTNSNTNGNSIETQPADLESSALSEEVPTNSQEETPNESSEIGDYKDDGWHGTIF